MSESILKLANAPIVEAVLEIGNFMLPRSGVSNEAKALRKALTAVKESQERSLALFGKKSEAISNMWGIATECALDGWDGGGAHDVDRLAVLIAEKFVRLLPESIALPEFAPESDGSISLDRIQSKNRLFSLSAGANNRLAYAWLDGTDKGHGVAHFDDERIPPRILEGINAIMNHGNASLRVA